MKNNMQVFFIALLVFLAGSFAHANEDEAFSSDKMISDLNEKIELSREQWEKLKPVLEEKSKELKNSVDDYVDKGFVQMDELSRKLKEVSDDTEQKVTAYLNSEEMQKLKNYLVELDKDAIKVTKDRMVTEFTEVLELTEEQMDKLKPVLEDSMTQISELISDLTQKGSSGWEDFKGQYKKLTEELKKQLEETLNEQQIEKFDEYKQDKQEKIQTALFV